MQLVYWSKCHGSSKGEVASSIATRARQNKYPGQCLGLAVCWQVQIAWSGHRGAYKPEMKKVSLEACWESVILSWKTLSIRETRSNLHFRKGTVAKVWKINWNRERLEIEGGRDNEGMNLEGSAFWNWCFALFNLSLSPHICTHTICIMFISNQSSP